MNIYLQILFSLWIISVGLHLLLVLRNSLILSKAKKRKTTSQTCKISVIIAARNEFENLQKLVPALLLQQHPDYEIVIALDRPTDQSAQYLEKMSHQAPLKLKYLIINETANGWTGKKFALQQAISKSSGDWLVFTDADCYPNSSFWLSGIEKEAQHDGTNIIVGISPYETGKGILRNYIAFEGFITAFQYVPAAINSNPYMAVGRNMAIEKSYFQKYRGYEEIKGVIGGDDDLTIQKMSTKTNTRVVLGKDSLVYTYPKETWKEYFLQKLRHLSVGTKYKASDKLSLTLFHLSHLLCIAFLPFSGFSLAVMVIILIYLVIKGLSYRFAAIKMGFKFNYFTFPLVDTMYGILIPALAVVSWFKKDIKWKN